MKTLLLLLAITFFSTQASQAQFKEAAQLATLTPAFFVATSDIDNYKKLHYMISTIGYLGSYMITDSYWKSILITLGAGVVKELIYDGLLGRGEPLWEDMKWNTFGVGQGFFFTIALTF